MPRIRCHYIDCVFIDDGRCGAAAIELEVEHGCIMYSSDGKAEMDDEEDWEKDGEDEETDEAEELDAYDDDDDEEDWVDLDDEEY